MSKKKQSKTPKPRDMNIANQIAEGVRAPKFEDRRTKRKRTKKQRNDDSIKEQLGD